jgi:hypothetical protein
MDHEPLEDAGYSPPVNAELHLHGQIFQIAAVAPEYIVVRNPRRTPQGIGRIWIWIDGIATEIEARMHFGIDPKIEEQMCNCPALLDLPF